MQESQSNTARRGAHRATLGVDTGGTFTDLVLATRGGLRVEKLASTPADPARAVLEGIAQMGCADLARVVHGTTVALNALLTGRVARTAIVTQRGFQDLIEIGRQDRPDLYALHPLKTPELVPRELRFEIDSRVWPDPEASRSARRFVTVSEPADADLERLAAELRRARPEAIAVCLLHSYADPRIERRVADALRSLGVPITCSAELLREYREFERFSTAVVNAALTPVLSEYLASLSGALRPTRLELLQSSGGTLRAERAAVEPVRVLLSGPAGGVLGAARAAREAGFERLVSLDMGGTSADVAFHDLSARGADSGALLHSGVLRIAGHPIAVPALDIHTIGCGGGSLVRVDSGGVLHVGPQSAGADPGPVCYGRSDQLTVTDAHVLLGHIAEGPFLGGRLALDVDAVHRQFERLAERLRVRPVAAAQAVLDVARAAMRRALAVMTMQRGVDPQAIPLVAFGGAGGLHAAPLAESLSMPCALVPRHPGALSALGLATAEPRCELSRSVLAPLTGCGAAEVKAWCAALGEEARAQVLEAGAAAGAIRCSAALDLRYQGQSFELRVPFSRSPADSGAEFERRHERLYGYRMEAREIELVTVRVVAVASRPAARVSRARARKLDPSAILGVRRAHFGGSPGGSNRALSATRIDRERLTPGQRFGGPALVEEFSGTSLLPPGWTASVTSGGHLLLERD
jgi:N-methylhydantoinase A